MFDDNDADRFVRGHFTDRVVAAYFALPMVVQRADLARYLMLYEFGGVYTDMDTVCFTAIDKWSYGLKDVAAIVGVEVFSSENGKDQIAQWTMAFAPRHPFLDYMIRRLTDHILTSPRTVLENLDDVVGLTGPAFWSKAFWDYLRNRGYHIEPHLQGLDRGYRRLGDILLLGRVHFRHPGIFSKHRGTGEMKGGWKHALQLPRLSVGPGERILKAVLQPLLATGVSPLTNVCVFPFRVMRPWVSAPDVQNPSCEVTNPDHVFLTLDAPDVRRFARGVLSGSPNGGGGVVTGAGIDAAGLRVLLDSRLNDPQVRALGPLLSLYHFGGVLIHADTVCRRPLEVWWRDSPRVGLVVGIEEPQTIVFAAKPRHAFVGRLIDGLVLLLNAKSDEELRMINASALAAYHLPTMVTGSLEKLGCTVLRSGKGVMCAGDILLRKRE
ncbi:hypothetical protein BC830DRAFT_1135940 [Chytriomyces sp. MP71]|nr:hypothetical protein BC830DRAFT_1135940 [Chytriomyces sp. MP71]